MSKWIEAIANIVVPLVYGLLVSAAFTWLHRRRAAASSEAGAGGQSPASGDAERKR